MESMGIKGLTYRKYDDTMCTYCSIITGALIIAIMLAWKGGPWDDVEILTGKKNGTNAWKEEDHTDGALYGEEAQGQSPPQ